jgi:transcriptional regulator with XRE-family HTH domain
VTEQANAALGLAVRELRTKKAMTQEQLAQKAELHPTYLSGIETGARNPTWRTITRVCEALGVRVSELARLAERLEGERPS